MANYIEDYLNGKSTLQDIDNYIDVWSVDPQYDDIPLNEFLGMTEDEYSIFVENKDQLLSIIEKRKTGKV